MAKIKIASPVLGIDPRSNSGGGVYDREVLVHLAQKGNVVQILLPKKRPYPKHANFRVSFAPITHVVPSYIFNIFTFFYLTMLYKKEGFDLVRVHNPYFTGIGALLFKFFHPEVPIVASYLHLENKNWRFNLIDRFIVDKFDWVITISEFSKKELSTKYPQIEDKISVIYPGVSPKFRPTYKKRNLVKKYDLTDKFVCLYLGGLKKRKNPVFIIDIARKLKNENITFLICGSGPEFKKMHRLIQLYNLEKRVILAGFVAEEEKVDFYNLADIFLLPSLKEGFGMIVIEAAACGKPGLVSNKSALPETVKDGRNGFVIDLDLNKWAEKINLLATDELLLKKMSGGAISYSYNFSWEHNVGEHLKIFSRLLGKK